jgi:hypothetical protein
MSDKVLVPLSGGGNTGYALHEVLLFPPQDPHGKTWTIKSAGVFFTTFLENLKKSFYSRCPEADNGIEIRLDPHISLQEIAESALLGLCVKIEMAINKQGTKTRWASVTITGHMKDNSFSLAEAKDTVEKYKALADRVKGEAAGTHLFVYVSDKKISLGGENEVLPDNIHIKRFLSGRPLRDVFEWLFAPMVSSEGGRYFENHTIYDRFNQVYNDLCLYNKKEIKKDEMQYYNDTDRISFTRTHYWKLIPEKIREDDKENCEKYRDLFFAEIDPYMDYPVKHFLKKAPFIIAEHYFYYDILRKFCIKPSLVNRRDPYKKEKEAFGTIKNSRLYIKQILKSNLSTTANEEINRILKNLIAINSTDQSQIHHRMSITTKDHTLVIDDREEFLEYLANQGKRIKRVDIILDNYGLEFIYVIQLAMNIIRCCAVEKDCIIHFHLKVWPTYVSDVILSEYGDDVDNINRQIRDMSKSNVPLLSNLDFLEQSGQIVWQPDMFWNTHLPFKDMPEKLKKGFDISDLIIVMSDLNYRKLIEDREWSCDTEIKGRIEYLSAPVLIVRALKSNSLISITQDKAKEYKEKYDSEWRTTGHLGIIQFVNMREHTQ